jgi:imidazolonepropionase-like amidohydrolase
MKKLIYTMLACLLLVGGLSAQVAKAKKGTFALTNASIQTVTKGLVTGTLLIQDGKIAALGANVAIPAGAETINCQGLTLYPAFIDAGTNLGLVEVSSVDVTVDADELGDLTPQMEAITAVNPNSVAIPVTRVDGISTVLVTPEGGRFPGTASLINLAGYSPDQMYAGYKAIVMNFPSSGGSFFDQRSEEERKKDEEKALKKLNEYWDNAILYHRIDSAARKDPTIKVAYNPEMAALAQVLRSEMPMLIEVNKADEIERALKWVTDRKLKNVVFTGVAEGWRVADKIAKAKIPVITGPVIAIPTRASDRYDKAYANPGLMHKAGVKVAIRSNDSENVRNLPFHAAFAAAYGMGKEEALRAITITPAEILGVDKQYGSLEVGKVANVFAATGDPLETKTQIKHLFITGYQIPLDSRHIQLYQEFLERSHKP